MTLKKTKKLKTVKINCAQPCSCAHAARTRCLAARQCPKQTLNNQNCPSKASSWGKGSIMWESNQKYWGYKETMMIDTQSKMGSNCPGAGWLRPPCSIPGKSPHTAAVPLQRVDELQPLRLQVAHRDRPAVVSWQTNVKETSGFHRSLKCWPTYEDILSLLVIGYAGHPSVAEVASQSFAWYLYLSMLMFAMSLNTVTVIPNKPTNKTKKNWNKQTKQGGPVLTQW